MTIISSGYLQLGKVFECLEAARFTPDTDFGANPAAAYEWYLSPAAKKFLEKRNQSEWLFLKYNTQFDIKYDKWVGISETGVAIRLKLISVPVATAYKLCPKNLTYSNRR